MTAGANNFITLPVVNLPIAVYIASNEGIIKLTVLW